MKRNILIIVLVFLNTVSGFAQDWMTSLDIAKRLALTQDKMILMMWEEATYYPLPVLFTDKKGEQFAIENLFENEAANTILWDYFVPVRVSESQYDEMYAEIAGKRRQSYIDKFNDDSVKIMDAAGNIVNISSNYATYLDLNYLILTYAWNTSFIKSELTNYIKNPDFYSAYYLASKYQDYAILNNKQLRSKILNLSDIYLNEARGYIENNDLENELTLSQRADLLEMKAQLISNRARKVRRQLNRLNSEDILEANQTMVAFLYYTAYQMLGDDEAMTQWKDKVASIDLRKAQMIANINAN